MPRFSFLLVPALVLANSLQAGPVPPRVIAFPEPPRSFIPIPPHSPPPARPSVVVPHANATVKIPSVRITPPDVVVDVLSGLVKYPPQKPK